MIDRLQLIAFFDNHVHGSLADFKNDATLPSDPRVIYIGDNVKMPYAKNERGRSLGNGDLDGTLSDLG